MYYIRSAGARALQALLSIVPGAGAHHMGRTRYSAGQSRSGRGFNPRLNRHTGQPHEHAREISRRLRQQERAA